MSFFGQQTQQQNTMGGGGGGFGFGGGQASQGFGGGQNMSAGFNASGPTNMSSGFGQQQQVGSAGGMFNQSAQKPPYTLEPSECEVEHQFTESISDIRLKQINPGNAYMAVSAWDGKIIVYTVSAPDQGGMGGMAGTAKPPQV